MNPLEAVLGKLPGAKKSGNGWSARCPAHDDHRASLWVVQGSDGRVLIKCHAGCSRQAVCDSIGLQESDLVPAGDASGNGKRRIVARYDYNDESGTLLFQVVRFDPKDFRQRQPVAGGGWKWSVKGIRVVP